MVTERSQITETKITGYTPTGAHVLDLHPIKNLKYNIELPGTQVKTIPIEDLIWGKQTIGNPPIGTVVITRAGESSVIVEMGGRGKDFFDTYAFARTAAADSYLNPGVPLEHSLRLETASDILGGRVRRVAETENQIQTFLSEMQDPFERADVLGARLAKILPARQSYYSGVPLGDYDYGSFVSRGEEPDRYYSLPPSITGSKYSIIPGNYRISQPSSIITPDPLSSYSITTDYNPPYNPTPPYTPLIPLYGPPPYNPPYNPPTTTPPYNPPPYNPPYNPPSPPYSSPPFNPPYNPPVTPPYNSPTITPPYNPPPPLIPPDIPPIPVWEKRKGRKRPARFLSSSPLRKAPPPPSRAGSDSEVLTSGQWPGTRRQHLSRDTRDLQRSTFPGKILRPTPSQISFLVPRRSGK